jgi:DNA ligase-1
VDDETLRACHRATGDSGETLQLLLEAYPAARQGAQRTLLEAVERPALSVREAADELARLAASPAAAKPRLLESAWRALSPLEVKYFTKIVTGGMRIGLSESLVEEAVARAFGRDVEAVRLASMLSGDVGETAVLARRDRLGEARFRLFHPLGFMLASPVEEPPADLASHQVEDKYDGIRAQLHVADGRAELYSRTLEAAREFPELVEAARRIPHEVVLDGEVVAVRNEGSAAGRGGEGPDAGAGGFRVAPFALLQRRLGRKSPDAGLRLQVPVRYVAYDVMFLDGEPLYGKPLRERRAALESLALRTPLAVSPLVPPDFEAARARGNEGLMFKRLDSAYELGKRGQSWLKLKRAFATLDVVVTAAELGHGKRAGLLSDVTFAVRGPDGGLLNVGKAYSGLTNEEIREMTSILKSLTIERYSSVHRVRPQIVLEVAFDSVTRSKRHKSGYALRFPRIVRWRRDKPADQIDGLDRVEELWRSSGGAETLEA